MIYRFVRYEMSRRRSEEEKNQALALYVVIGNATKVSEQLQIPATTLRDWTRTDWWIEKLEKLRSEKDNELDIQLSRNIELAGEQIRDRTLDSRVTGTEHFSCARRPLSNRDYHRPRVEEGILFQDI